MRHTPIAILIFGTALVFCLVFLLEQEGQAVVEPIRIDSGRVLGVSEAVADMEDPGLYRLPASPEPKTSTPVKADNVRDLYLGDCSAVVMDSATGQVLFAQEADKVRPIASITKLMSALVFLDHNPGWESFYKVTAADRLDGGRIYVYNGEEVKVRDLFHLSLVASANTATKALANSTGLTPAEFVQAMNKKALNLGLQNTSFADPAGLSAYNQAPAQEIARLLKHALDQEAIAAATRLSDYGFSTKAGRSASVANTNYMADDWAESDMEYLGGKTGHTELAGYCFTGAFENALDKGIISVVLGTDSPSARFRLTEKMAQWTYASYVWN